MKLHVQHQESYSRLELLLRTFFGWLYIALPHGFLLMFLGIWSAILTFVAFWVVLFTGSYPQSMFSYQEKYLRWGLRLRSRIINLSDGYPAFGLNAADDRLVFEIPYPEKQSRLLLLLRLFFGWIYVGIPHGFLLFFRAIATCVVIFIAWWVVLITGKYPPSMHAYVNGLLRWSLRVNIYLLFMTDDYPPFNGKEGE
jgi:Domain of unknown function (DUF4389)